MKEKPTDDTEEQVLPRQRLNLRGDVNPEHLAFFGMQETPREPPAKSTASSASKPEGGTEQKLNMNKLFGAQQILAKALQTLCNRHNLHMPTEESFQEASKVWNRGMRTASRDLQLYARSGSLAMTVKLVNGNFRRPISWGRKTSPTEYAFIIDSRGLNTSLTSQFNKALVIDGIDHYL